MESARTKVKPFLTFVRRSDNLIPRDQRDPVLFNVLAKVGVLQVVAVGQVHCLGHDGLVKLGPKVRQVRLVSCGP